MKKSTLNLFVLVLFIGITVACSKKQDLQPQIQIDEKNLTDCPNGLSCKYWFTENNILSPNAPFGNNDIRIFYAALTTDIGTTIISIETPRLANSFTLTAEDIINGKAVINNSCPACYSAPFKLVGGSIKGINKSARETRPTKSEKWLIEAQIIRQYLGSTTDTIYVKQYFYPMSY